MSSVPVVLFVCVHNAGRSQMAAGYLQALGGERVRVLSAGSEPKDAINQVAVEVMAEEGIDIAANRPAVLTTEAVRESDVVITMGCGDACPIFPGKRYEDWELTDPAGLPAAEVRPIRDEIRSRVEALLIELFPDNGWPRLAVDEWADTRTTFHMWTQIVGKIRMAFAPMVNHWWQVPLYVTARGLTTSAIPYGTDVFEIEFDLLVHRLEIRRSDGRITQLPLEAMTVAEFYEQVLSALEGIGIEVAIHDTPNEVDPAIPFADDIEHASYDPRAVTLFWRQLVQAERVLTAFRSGFTGKVSPVHLFWGALDLAVTRFSGRTAPEHPGGVPNCPDRVMVEGYSHEISSAGFWPGGGAEGAFYSYAYPAPEGFAEAPVPAPAYYSEELGEFVLPYEAVAGAENPDALVAEFLEATYDAARRLGHWPEAGL
jgi:protein-tyrosine-phosphatase